MRTPIRHSPDPMYAEFDVHRTMIRDTVRTEAFQRAIAAVVRPGDVVLDVGAGSGILSIFAARAGAARVYAVEETTIAVLAQELAAANGVGEIVQVIQGDARTIEPPERVDVIVSEWLGGFGIDEGMLVPVIAARDRWLKPGGVMIPHTVTAWAALVHDRHLGRWWSSCGTTPTAWSSRAWSRRPSTRSSLPAAPITWPRVTDVPPQDACGPRTRARSRSSRRGRLTSGGAAPVHDQGTANALALWFSAELAPDISLSVGPGDPPTHWGMTTAPLPRRWAFRPAWSCASESGTPCPARRDLDQLGDRAAGSDWEEHDEQAI